MYGRMYGNVPYIRHHNQPVVSARNTKYKWKRCPLSCLSPENDVTFNAYHMGPSTMSPFMLIIGMTSFYAYQSVEKLYIAFTQNRVFFRSGLSGLSFRSRQNSQCLLLTLPVLFDTNSYHTNSHNTNSYQSAFFGGGGATGPSPNAHSVGLPAAGGGGL